MNDSFANVIVDLRTAAKERTVVDTKNSTVLNHFADRIQAIIEADLEQSEDTGDV